METTIKDMTNNGRREEICVNRSPILNDEGFHVGAEVPISTNSRPFRPVALFTV